MITALKKAITLEKKNTDQNKNLEHMCVLHYYNYDFFFQFAYSFEKIDPINVPVYDKITFSQTKNILIKLLTTTACQF